MRQRSRPFLTSHFSAFLLFVRLLLARYPPSTLNFIIFARCRHPNASLFRQISASVLVLQLLTIALHRSTVVTARIAEKRTKRNLLLLCSFPHFSLLTFLLCFPATKRENNQISSFVRAPSDSILSVSFNTAQFPLYSTTLPPSSTVTQYACIHVFMLRTMARSCSVSVLSVLSVLSVASVR